MAKARSWPFHDYWMATLSVAQGPCSAVLPTLHGCHYAFQKFPFFCVTLYVPESVQTDREHTHSRIAWVPPTVTQGMKLLGCETLTTHPSLVRGQEYVEVFHHSHIIFVRTRTNITFLLHLTVLQSSTKLVIGDACMAVLLFVCYATARMTFRNSVRFNMTERLL